MTGRRNKNLPSYGNMRSARSGAVTSLYSNTSPELPRGLVGGRGNSRRALFQLDRFLPVAVEFSIEIVFGGQVFRGLPAAGSNHDLIIASAISMY